MRQPDGNLPDVDRSAADVHPHDMPLPATSAPFTREVSPSVGRPHFSPPVDPRFHDLAVHCLVHGSCSPEVDAIDPDTLDSVLDVLALTFRAYQEADFDSFVHLRAGDLDHASLARRPDVEELHSILVDDLGVDGASLPQEWVAALRAYWTAFYQDPPVQRFLPDTASMELRRVDAPQGAPSPQLGPPKTGATAVVGNRLVIEHCTTPEQILERDGSLTWFDFGITFETGTDATRARLSIRHAWDPEVNRWFVVRASTTYPKRYDIARNRSYLLF